MAKDSFAFYENQKRSRTATCTNVVKFRTASDIEFKQKNASQGRKPCKIVLQHPKLHLKKSILLHLIPIFLIVMPQLTILQRLLARTKYCFIALPGKLKTDFLTQFWQWHMINIRSQTKQELHQLQAHQKIIALINEDDQSLAIDRNKLKRQRAKFREALREVKTNIFKLVDGIYVDGRKDAAQVICSINEKFYQNVILEEHYVIVGEPGKFYLTNCSPEDGKEATISKCLYNAIKDITLQEKLAVNGCHRTAALTGVNMVLCISWKKN